MPATPVRLLINDPALARAGKRAIVQALALIHERHESGRVPSHMHYHNCAHTIGVIKRAQAIGVAIGISDRHMLLTVIAAAFHDVVQRWEAVAKEGGVVMRQRHIGQDEVASAHEAVEAMADLGVKFTAEEDGVVASAIIATIPGWDVEASTVKQPFLVDHPVLSAVALADIGAAGMDPDVFRLDGPALFAEENLDLMIAISTARRVHDIPATRREFYRDRYIGWLRIQPGFARGRHERLVKREIAGYDGEIQERMLDLFSHFERSVAGAEAAVERAEQSDFVTLMRQLDEQAFPDEQNGAHA